MPTIPGHNDLMQIIHHVSWDAIDDLESALMSKDAKFTDKGWNWHQPAWLALMKQTAKKEVRCSQD